MKKVNSRGYTRIQKKDVINKLKLGMTVYVVPCNIAINNLWGMTTAINMSMMQTQGNNFENWYNYYKAMNCTNTEVGRYPAFYIES